MPILLNILEIVRSPTSSATAVWVGSVMTLATVQWLCVQFMARYCAPCNLFGLFTNVLSLGSPICHAVNKFQLDISSHFITMCSMAVPVAVAAAVNKSTTFWKLKN